MLYPVYHVIYLLVEQNHSEVGMDIAVRNSQTLYDLLRVNTKKAGFRGSVR